MAKVTIHSHLVQYYETVNIFLIQIAQKTKIKQLQNVISLFLRKYFYTHYEKT